MVSSAKKKRGQQRKAAKKTSSAGASSGGVSDNDFEQQTSKNYIITEARNRIQRGDNLATIGLLDPKIPFPIQKAALPDVLNFLKRCEDETFHQVMASVGGDLKSPSLWIHILRDSVKSSCSLQIAENIGPLVKCMCNDMERLFFKSNKHWREGIMPFVELISNILSNSIDSTNTDKLMDKKILNTVLQNEGLLTSFVQWGFWKNHRPDIVKVLGVENCEIITNLGQSAIPILIMDEDNFIEDKRFATDDAKKRLRSIGASPIVSTDYDITCTTSFVVSFIRLVKEEGSWQRTPNSSILEYLIGDADCVDRDVINEVIDLGRNHTSDFESAESAANKLTCILCDEVAEDDYCHPNDTRIAFAIREGLIDVCLCFIRRFRWHKSFFRKTDNDCLYSDIEYILNVICDVSLHKKTAKALRHKKDEIQIQLNRLEKITCKTEVKELFDMVECILDNTGAYCCRCNTSLNRTEVMECNGCGQMSYCSKECQREDWLNGHSFTCCKSYTEATAGQFQGRILPRTTSHKIESVLTYDQDGQYQVVLEDERAATKLVELEKNITSMQLKLFLDHSEYIKSQASSLNIPLCDCVVVFDLRCCLTEVEVKKYTDHYMPKAAKGYRKSRSKENITCIYNSYVFNGSLAAKDDWDEIQHYNVPKLSMQKMFPHEWLLDESPTMRKHKHRQSIQREKNRGNIAEQSWTYEEEFDDICRQS